MLAAYDSKTNKNDVRLNAIGRNEIPDSGQRGGDFQGTQEFVITDVRQNKRKNLRRLYDEELGEMGHARTDGKMEVCVRENRRTRENGERKRVTGGAVDIQCPVGAGKGKTEARAMDEPKEGQKAGSNQARGYSEFKNKSKYATDQ